MWTLIHASLSDISATFDINWCYSSPPGSGPIQNYALTSLVDCFHVKSNPCYTFWPCCSIHCLHCVHESLRPCLSLRTVSPPRRRGLYIWCPLLAAKPVFHLGSTTVNYQDNNLRQTYCAMKAPEQNNCNRTFLVPQGNLQYVMLKELQRIRQFYRAWNSKL